jgi:hypothetical protein
MDGYDFALAIGVICFVVSVVNAVRVCKTSREELKDRADARRRLRYEGRDL